MRNTAIAICLVIVIVLFVLLINKPQPTISVDPDKWNLGKVSKSKQYFKLFTIKNTGKSSLLISKVRSSCFCTIVRVATNEVLPLSYTTLEASFLSHSVGRIERTIFIESNDPKNKVVMMPVSAEVY